MKWRLSSDSFPQKEISDTKSMSYASNDRTEIITGNKFSPSKLNDATTQTLSTKLASTVNDEKYKARTSTDSLIDQQIRKNHSSRHQNHHNSNYNSNRASLEEALRTNNDNNTNSHTSNNNQNDNQIFLISSNKHNSNINRSSSIRDETNQKQKSAPATNESNILDNDYNNSEPNNDFHHNYVNLTANPSSNGSIDKSGSTAKLLPAIDDQSSRQSKCSVFRNLVLCICLNVSYANIVRFPRELDQNGLAFLVPYFLLLFLVGFPIILLEISVGQFLGQGAANSWRSSPILKGACIISRFAAWLSTLWISLQAVLAALYIGMLIFKSVPFSNCVADLRISVEDGYKVYAHDGQDCIKKTFLTPVWDDPVYFGLLVILLILLWIIAMVCTHNAKIFRRTTFFFGLIGFGLLLALTGWEVHKSLENKYFPALWPFNEKLLTTCSLWFNALVQVIYSTNIGFGILPVVTGKFLYKGDAVRTSIVYLCFNLLINAIAVTLFMVQYDNDITKGSANELPELKSLTALYDKILVDYGNPLLQTNEIMLGKITACLTLTLIIISAIVSIATAIYTSSRLVPRHPNYVMSLIALTAATGSLVYPLFQIPRIFDSRVVGTLVISALVFDLIGTIWVYGKKNIYTDLEFSIGRPISKSWLYLWIFAPVVLTGILVWWCVGDDQFDVLYLYVPRWAPIAFVLIIIIIIAAIEVFRQVDYNFFGMICEAAKSAKEWGPADPLARHAWKQWRSVCQDTGRKDFTLRRRGTRDYTHSIKKGQYSTGGSGGKLGTPTSNWKSVSTPGSSSPNYSGSVFGDSAIEEDMSIDKYSGVNQNFAPFHHNESKQSRYSSNRSRKISQEKNKYNPPVPPPMPSTDKQQPQHKEILYIRRMSNENISANHSTRIEITPSSEAITYAATRNPMARTGSNASAAQQYKISLNPGRDLINQGSNKINEGGSNSGGNSTSNLDHICWRKFSVNSEEYSTEL